MPVVVETLVYGYEMFHVWSNIFCIQRVFCYGLYQPLTMSIVMCKACFILNTHLDYSAHVP